MFVTEEKKNLLILCQKKSTRIKSKPYKIKMYLLCSFTKFSANMLISLFCYNIHEAWKLVFSSICLVFRTKFSKVTCGYEPIKGNISKKLNSFLMAVCIALARFCHVKML